MDLAWWGSPLILVGRASAANNTSLLKLLDVQVLLPIRINTTRSFCKFFSSYSKNVISTINPLHPRNNPHHQPIPRSDPQRCGSRDRVPHRRRGKDLKLPSLISTPSHKSRVSLRPHSSPGSDQYSLPPGTISPSRSRRRPSPAFLAL